MPRPASGLAAAAAFVAGFLLQPTAATDASLGISTCADPPTEAQVWDPAISTGAWARLGNGSLCVAASACSPTGTTLGVALQDCKAPSTCQDSADTLFRLDRGTGFLTSNVTGRLGQRWCLTLAHVSGPGVNLWPCNASFSNTEWEWGAAAKTLESKGSPRGQGCLSRPGLPPPVAIVANGSALSKAYHGIGGLAAVGGARLLYEYPEPTRSEILDLMFKPSGGAAFQILKTEITGDMDSSYGSGPSYQHSRGRVDAHTGIYGPWLLQEARRRNPSVVTYALSWGVPRWVGNGSYYSDDGIDYHVGYLNATKDAFGLSFDFLGVWNEMPWKRAWVKQLRGALDAAGHAGTTIVMPDGKDGGCLDCPSSWGSGAVSALNHDANLASAVGFLGLHTSDPEGVSIGSQTLPKGVGFWNSENNVVDGPQPQFEPVPEQPYGSGLGWLRVALTNYVRGGATATILCPLMHSWSWNMGRQNHGLGQLSEPWSGHAELGAGFWAQAHLTQLTVVGWRFVDGGGSGEACGSSSSSSSGTSAATTPECDVVWATLAAPDASETTVVVVNTGVTDESVHVSFTGALFSAVQRAGRLAEWRTNASSWFVEGPGVEPPAAEGAPIVVAAPARSALSLSSMHNASRAVFAPAERTAPPLPFTASFDDQPPGDPGRMLSDVFGAFTVAESPSGSGNVLWQAAGANPGANAWHGHGDGAPATLLTDGYNLADANASAGFLLPKGQGGTARACARVPVWRPAKDKSTEATLGVCAELTVPAGSGAATLGIVETLPSPGGSKTWASAQVDGIDASTGWVSLWVQTAGEGAVAGVSSRATGAGATAHTDGPLAMPSGTAGFATGWHNAWLDDVRVAPAAGVAPIPAGSFLHSVLVGTETAHVSGWAGLVLSLANASSGIDIMALGRFRSSGNAAKHSLQVFDAASGDALLTKPVSVDMAASAGPSDALGFRYAPVSPSLTLRAGHTYYIVSEEDEEGDSTAEMTNPSRGTTHANRDGSTLMRYAGPGKGEVTGRVSGTPGQWTVVEGLSGLDTSFGPVNLVLG